MTILTGCNDKHYQLGLLSGLVHHDIEIDFIANDDMIAAANYEKVNYLNFRGDQDPQASIWKKVFRVLWYYGRLLRYTAQTKSRIFHIQWLNRFEYLDRTLINLYYKVMRKKLILTAHNINAGQRDGNDSRLNRWTLWFMYRIVDHIIVHTEKMKEELSRAFGLDPSKVSVIPHGIHDAIPCTDLTPLEARARLGLGCEEKVLLFFGNIYPYKGLEYLVRALPRLMESIGPLKTIIAGRAGDLKYWNKIEKILEEKDLGDIVVRAIGFIPDEEIEIFCKASDLLVLPYTSVFQSGVLFVAYNFGLPVIASDVGSLREEVIEGVTGFVCKSRDPDDLALKVIEYFHSDLYHSLEDNRRKIIEYAREKYSWRRIGEMTFKVYRRICPLN
ncbi:MAG: glycosyltransferase family 4 protein [Methanomassiliicoccales archaeon]